MLWRCCPRKNVSCYRERWRPKYRTPTRGIRGNRGTTEMGNRRNPGNPGTRTLEPWNRTLERWNLGTLEPCIDIKWQFRPDPPGVLHDRPNDTQSARTCIHRPSVATY